MAATEASRTWFFRVWTLIGVAIVLAGVWQLLHDAIVLVLPPLAIAAVLIYLLNPVVRWFERRGLPRAAGTGLSYLVVIGVLVAIGMVIGPIISRQTGDLVENFPDIAEGVQSAINTQLRAFGVDFQLDVDLGDGETQDQIVTWIEENREQLLELVRGAGGVLSAVIHVVLALVLAPFIAFYLLVDLPRLSRNLQRLVPPGPRSELLDVAQRIGRTVGAYFRGQLLVALFVAVATSIGLLIIDLPFWALVGGTTGVFNLIPLVGPFAGGAIGAIVALTVGDGLTQALFVIVVMTVVQQVDNHVITPNIVSRTVQVHPVTVIIGLAAAGALFGLPGMFVAIPTIAAAKLVVMYLLVTRVPAMSHLAAQGPGLFVDEFADEEPQEGTLAALGRELRSAWEQRRQPRGPGGGRPPDDDSPPSA